MRIYIVVSKITKEVKPKAFVNKQLAEIYVGDNKDLKIEDLYLDTTVDIKRNMSHEDLEAAMKMAI